MNNKKYKMTVVAIILLLVLALGLFLFDNLYLAKQERLNLVDIYVAKDDIQAKTEVKEGLFNVITINKDSVLPGYVTSLEEIKGKELKGGLLKGEVLSSQRMRGKGSDEGMFSLKIEPDFVGDLKAEDNIKVYVQLIDKNTKESQMKVLFDSKKVNKVTSSEGMALTDQQGVRVANIFVNANEKELQDYYVAKQRGYIVVAKYDIMDLEDVKSDKSNPTEAVVEGSKDTGSFDVNSEEVKNAKKKAENSDEAIGVMSYSVQDGETADTLSIKFKTDVETLEKLNGKAEFTVGETITVPAE